MAEDVQICAIHMENMSTKSGNAWCFMPPWTETLACTVCPVLHPCDEAHADLRVSDNVVATGQIRPKPLYSLVLATILILFRPVDFTKMERMRSLMWKRARLFCWGNVFPLTCWAILMVAGTNLSSFLKKKKSRSEFLHSALQHFLKNWLTFDCVVFFSQTFSF